MSENLTYEFAANAIVVNNVNMYGPAENFNNVPAGTAVSNYVLPGYDYVFNGTYQGTGLVFTSGGATLVVGGVYNCSYKGFAAGTSIYVSGAALVNTANSTGAYGGVWSLRSGNSTLALLGASVSNTDGRQNAYSGGLLNITAGSVVIDKSVISGQKATIGGALKLEGGTNTAVTISNTTFSGNIATAGGRGGAFESNANVIFENSTLATASDTINNNGNITFNGTCNINASLLGGAGNTYTLAENAALVFGNTADISISDLTFTEGNALTFGGTGKVSFASGEDLTGVSITIDTTDFDLAHGTYTLAANFAGVAAGDIVITGTNQNQWAATITGNTLKAEINAISTSLYGVADKFGGAEIGDKVFVTAYGKNFYGEYKGNTGGNGSVLMYGATVANGPFTNGHGYVYDSYVTGSFTINTGGSYEIINTLFDRTGGGVALWGRQESSTATTISGSTLSADSSFLLENNDVLEFQDTNYINGSITATQGVYRLAENAALVFGNTKTITVADLTFVGNNALTFSGSAQVNFTDNKDLSGVTITVGTNQLGDARIVAANVALAASQQIIVGGTSHVLGEIFEYGGAKYAFNYNDTAHTLSVTGFHDEVFVVPQGTETIVIGGETISLTGKAVYASLDTALAHLDPVGGKVTVFNTADSVHANYAYFLGTQSVDGDLKIAVDGLTYSRYYVSGKHDTAVESFGNVAGDIFFELRNLNTDRISLSGEDKAHDLCQNAVITVKNVLVNTQLEAGGSGTKCRIAGDVALNIIDSNVANVFVTRGNPIAGDAVINLAGATVGNVDGKKSVVGGSCALDVLAGAVVKISGNVKDMDALNVNAGANLLFSGSTITDTTLINNGTITVNGTCAAGTTYFSFFSYDGQDTLGTITSTNGGGIYTAADKLYYYNGLYVDSALSEVAKGTKVNITVGGETVTALYGVNAFRSSTDAKAADAGATLTVLNETVATNLYGQGDTVFADGSVAKTTYGGQLMKASGNAGDSSLTITGGTFASMVVGGSRVSVDAGASAQVTAGSTELTVTGGEFSNEKSYLAAAGYLINKGNGAALTVGESTLNLDGIELKKYAFGGAFADNGGVTIAQVNVNVGSGKYESVFIGGWAQNQGEVNVTGATVNISGGSIRNLYAGGTDSGDGTTNTATAVLNISGGTVRNVFLNGKYSRDTVTKATMNVTEACEINWIEGLCHSMAASTATTNTAVNIGANLTVEDILDVDEWNLTKVGSLLDFGTHTANLNGTLSGEQAVDTVIDFQIGGQSIGTEGWTAIAAQKFEGLKQSSVEINGQAASAYVSETNTWTFGTDYTVTLGQYNDTRKALIVSKLA